MTFYKNLYCDEAVEKNRRKVVRKLRLNYGQVQVYIVSIASGKDLFDIIHCANLKLKYYPKKDLYIMGLAASYEEAVKLSIRMFEDFSKKYETHDFKEKLINDLNIKTLT